MGGINTLNMVVGMKFQSEKRPLVDEIAIIKYQFRNPTSSDRSLVGFQTLQVTPEVTQFQCEDNAFAYGLLNFEARNVNLMRISSFSYNMLIHVI